MPFDLSSDVIIAFFSVIMIDVVLAGDNAVAVGIAAAGLPAPQRRQAIMVGIVAATVLRIVLAMTATQLLQIIGLMLAGGILLLWVAWKLWSELSAQRREAAEQEASDAAAPPPRPTKTLKQAIWQIIAADISMSLDNVLAVAGAALEHPIVLAFGLVLSVALMGVAATLIANLLEKHRWIAYVGIAIIAYVALHMIVEGSETVAAAAQKAGLF